MAQTSALAAHGFAAPSRKIALSVVGLSLMEAFAALIGPEGPLQSLADAYKAAWTELRQRPGFRDRLYPGAAEMIAELASAPRTRLGIATGKSRAGVDRILAAEGWRAVFATIQTADAHPSKPDPSMILAAMAETGAATTRTIVVGDTSYDMEMAVRAGARPIGVAWGYHPQAALLTSGAEIVAQSFDELRALLHPIATA